MENRNYWLKLRWDFFSQPCIKELREAAVGDTFVIIYQKLLLSSIETNGLITFFGMEKTIEEEIAIMLGEKLDNVIAVFEFMKANKLIKATKKENIYQLSDTPYLG